MRKNDLKLKDFLHSRIGMVLVFVIVFYVVTFAVYYFYSPGPEERRQAELKKTAETVSAPLNVTQE